MRQSTIRLFVALHWILSFSNPLYNFNSIIRAICKTNQLELDSQTQMYIQSKGFFFEDLFVNEFNNFYGFQYTPFFHITMLY